jgi:hypothetical protein
MKDVMSLVSFLIIGPPMLFGAAFPWVVWITLAVAIGFGYGGIRLSRQPGRWSRVAAWTGFVISAYLAFLPPLGFIGSYKHHRWVTRDLMRSACGIRSGMTRAEARNLASRCARLTTDTEEGFGLRPRGLARLQWLDFGVYGIAVKYDATGRVIEAIGWAD